MMKTRNGRLWRWRVLVWACGLMLAVLVAAFVVISLRIGADVRAVAALAVQEYGGDRVGALIRYVDDPDHPLPERNRAVWALGQLGDRRALVTLRRHYRGEPCDHGTELCQRELGKAIELLDGAMNATALVWRH